MACGGDGEGSSGVGEGRPLVATSHVILRVRVAWWVRIYVLSVSAFAGLAGLTPDMEKVGRIIARGVKVEAR